MQNFMFYLSFFLITMTWATPTMDAIFRNEQVQVNSHHTIFRALPKETKMQLKKERLFAQIENWNERKTSVLSDPAYDDVFQFIPQFKAALMPNSTVSSWNATCFTANQGSIVTDDNGGEITFQVSNSTSTLCTDLYLICDNENFYVREFFEHGEHTITIDGWKVGEREDVEENGMKVFLIPGGIIDTLVDIIDTVELFMGNDMVENNVEWMEKAFNTTFPKREKSWTMLNETQVQSGDYLAIRRWDGIDNIIMFGTGGRTGHTAIVLEMDEGMVICESTGETNYWPSPYGIICTPYNQWIQQASDAAYDVAVLRLADDLLKNWDNDAAVAFVKTQLGYPYGYHNFLFGWIDTQGENFPPPLGKQFIYPLTVLVNNLDFATAQQMFLYALNLRLGYDDFNLDIYGVMDECEVQNTTLLELITTPENDSWIYPDGPSSVCDVFVLKVFRAAGVFGDLGDEIQMTEQTPKDSYQMQIYNGNWTMPSECNQQVDQLPFCQIMGEYLLELPGFNSIKPYANMNENCAAQPPDYRRYPENC